jgi:hypothetical protein
MVGRKVWQRPQAMIWSEYAPTVNEQGFYVPIGYEKFYLLPENAEAFEENAFMVLSDHNRAPIDINKQRIEQRQRMANGTMRSFHIADKLTLTTSWSMLPSRSYISSPFFDEDGKASAGVPGDANQDGIAASGELVPITTKADRFNTDKQYTVDGGAGGAELLQWYEDHTGPFWVMLSYDKYTNFPEDSNQRNRLGQYSQAFRAYISQFDYSIQKRGGNNYDMWNISVTLEEA